MILICLFLFFAIFESNVAASPFQSCCNPKYPKWFCPTGQQCYPYPKGTFPDCHG